MDIEVLDDNPIYKGEKYRLKFMFSNNYPIGALRMKTQRKFSENADDFHRSTGSRLREGLSTSHTHAPARLLQRHHLPRSA